MPLEGVVEDGGAADEAADGAAAAEGDVLASREVYIPILWRGRTM